ncbi:MAG: hypothetical protein WC815_13580 [Vicinamibacterales bacterium]|jgi:hypothetical protein
MIRLITSLFVAVFLLDAAPSIALAQAADGPVYVAYFWRAKPGQADAYNDYIKGTAEKIDEDARKAGVFEEVVTVTPSQMGTSVTIADWTHLRIFKLKNRAAAEALGKGLDEATLRVVPDDAQRKRNSERSASLRDFVRQEVWTALR